MESTPTSFCNSTHSDCALMRAEARGPSATLMASTSFSLQYCARSMMRPGSAPFGGSRSTETTNCLPSLRASGLFVARARGRQHRQHLARGLLHAHRAHEVPDVGGRGATAAAHHAHARGQEAPRV